MLPSLIESLRIEERKICLLPLHEKRMIRSLSALAPNSSLLQALRFSGLPSLLHSHLPHDLPTEVCKLRFVYTPNGLQDVTITAYTPRPINRLVPIDLPDYAFYCHKWVDRSVLIRPSFLEDGEEPIYVKRDRLTDTSFSNVALRMEPNGVWLTPKTPLLEGIMRQHLLAIGTIRTATLTLSDLHTAHEISLINAMLPLERCTIRP